MRILPTFVAELCSPSATEATEENNFNKSDFSMTRYIFLIFIFCVNLFQPGNIKAEGHIIGDGVERLSIFTFIYSSVVKKGNAQLSTIVNNGITEVRSNVKLLELRESLNTDTARDSNYKSVIKIIGYIFIIVIVLLILVFIWVWLLRSQIKKKTESLNLKNQELQKSEEKFRIITENSSDIIWHLDSNLNLTYISPSDERIRGFKKEEIMGDSLFSILKPEGIELIMEANKRRLIDKSKGIRSNPVIYELEELCKDGSWVWVEATATAYFDKEGNITGYHGVSRDISERKKAEELLKERENQLRELVATKDKLFSIIAHDLRSPFNALFCFSELLMKNPKGLEDAEAESYLEIINSLSKNTLDLLDNLLSWAKAQTGQLIFKPEKASLSTIINEIFEISNPVAKIKNITLSYTQANDVEVFADVNMLKTILRNLISNAIKFTNSNGEIVIYAIKDQNNIEITVSDNGIGMNEETMGKLFSIDEKLPKRGTADEKGSGLGLILCKEFVEKHGGTIWIESEPGKGSDFKFSLPLE